MGRRNLGSALASMNGVGPGFDTLRVALAVAILVFHSCEIPNGSEEVWQTPIRYVAAALVPAFFAVSGFLVLSSALRTSSLSVFVSFRLLRILPALSTEVAVSAVVVGALVTSHPLASYYGDPGFWGYFGNIAGKTAFTLPGVFENNPARGVVNASLWTIQPEILCYLLLSVGMLSGLHARRRAVAVAAVILMILSATVAVHVDLGPENIYFPARLKAFTYFVIGALFFSARDSIPFNGYLAAAALACSLPLLQFPGLDVLAAPAVVYATIYLGLTPLWRPDFLTRGDYSYGIYLYSFPIQQLIVLLSPESWRSWYVNAAIALPASLVLAMVSWHVVEKPFLRLKSQTKRLSRIEPMILGKYVNRFLISFALCMYACLIVRWSGAEVISQASKMWFYSVSALISAGVASLCAMNRRRPESGDTLELQGAQGAR